MQIQFQGQGQALTRTGKAAPAQPRIKHALMRRVLIQKQQGVVLVAQHKIGPGHLPEITQRPHLQRSPDLLPLLSAGLAR